MSKGAKRGTHTPVDGLDLNPGINATDNLAILLYYLSIINGSDLDYLTDYYSQRAFMLRVHRCRRRNK